VEKVVAEEEGLWEQDVGDCHGDGIIIISLRDELEEVCWKKWKKFCCCTKKRSLWVELEEEVVAE